MEERRKNDPWRIAIENQIVDLNKKVDDNTAVTVETKKKVDEVHDVLNTIKGGIKALGWLAAVAKWGAAIAGFVSAIWLLWYQHNHSGSVPPIIDVPKK